MRSRLKLIATVCIVITIFMAWSISHTSERFSSSVAKEAGQTDISINIEAKPLDNNPIASENSIALGATEEKTEAIVQPNNAESSDVMLDKEGQADRAELYTGNTVQQEAVEVKQGTASDRTSSLVPGVVNEKAAAITNKDVEIQDYAKAAGIILGKLSLSEIKFLFDEASDDFWITTPVEEIEKVRNIIFSKLTEADLSMLRELGNKYGRSMTILKPDIDVAATKAKQVANKLAKK